MPCTHNLQEKNQALIGRYLLNFECVRAQIYWKIFKRDSGFRRKWRSINKWTISWLKMARKGWECKRKWQYQMQNLIEQRFFCKTMCTLHVILTNSIALSSCVFILPESIKIRNLKSIFKWMPGKCCDFQWNFYWNWANCKTLECTFLHCWFQYVVASFLEEILV